MEEPEAREEVVSKNRFEFFIRFVKRAEFPEAHKFDIFNKCFFPGKRQQYIKRWRGVSGFRELGEN